MKSDEIDIYLNPWPLRSSGICYIKESEMQDETDILLRVTVDRLAHIKSVIATLQDEEAALRAELADSGRTVIKGTEHRATVLRCEGKIITDWRSIALRMNPSHQLVTAHTTQGDPYTVVRLSAHKTSK